MDTRVGKDDIAGNVMVVAVLSAVADLWPSPLVVWPAPSVPTLLARGLPVMAFLQKRAIVDKLAVPSAQPSIY